MADGSIRGILEGSIDELPDELRTVFVACVVDGMTPEQFAELSALASESVEARLHNAPNSLVEVLIRQLVPPSVASMELDDSRSERITNAVMDRLFRRNMNAAKPARQFSRKPIARTVGSETGLFRQQGFRTARSSDGGEGVPRLSFAHHGVHFLQVTTRLRLGRSVQG